MKRFTAQCCLCCCGCFLTKDFITKIPARLAGVLGAGVLLSLISTTINNIKLSLEPRISIFFLLPHVVAFVGGVFLISVPEHRLADDEDNPRLVQLNRCFFFMALMIMTLGIGISIIYGGIAFGRAVNDEGRPLDPDESPLKRLFKWIQRKWGDGRSGNNGSGGGGSGTISIDKHDIETPIVVIVSTCLLCGMFFLLFFGKIWARYGYKNFRESVEYEIVQTEPW
jgi:hypothetical protein